ncbi:MAG: hypothetical protein LAP39_18740 [Acidobacteriia bacterium]|nr:hypothetical protein [Terriglobia bacterium]
MAETRWVSRRDVDERRAIPPFTVGPTPPDPPPGWREALRWAAQVRNDLRQHIRSNPREVQTVAELLGKHFGVEPVEFLGGSNKD